MEQRVVLEGIVGSGKTCLLNIMGGIGAGFRIHPEPLEEWKAQGDVLEAFYKGAPGSGFVAQTLISQTLIQRDVPINSGSDEYAYLYERSIFSAHHCFIPAMQAADQLTSIEANILVNKNQGWGWRKWGVKQKWSTDHSIFCLGFFI